MRQISITVTGTAHWHALIGKAEYIARHLLPQGIEDYRVRLFMRFEQEGASNFHKKQIQERIVSTEEKLQRPGDQCLLLCGFYPEASLEFGVALDEFETMGSEVYQKLASIESGEDEMIYEYLATNFDQVTGLLCHISVLSGKSVRRQGHKTTEDYEELAVSLNRTEQIPFSSPISHRVLN
ncbi:MAG: hypothetical protein O7D86_06590 [Proteobacteria bacterium]|nr:hypothetical protein [Pseudomonadota bacterium]